jgi:hypothetical protein
MTRSESQLLKGTEKKRRPRRRWTVQGRIIYDREPHTFSIRDAERVSEAVMLRLTGNKKTERQARDFLRMLFTVLLKALMPSLLFDAVGLPIVNFIMGLIDRTVERWYKLTAEGKIVDPGALAEVVLSDAVRQSLNLPSEEA